MFESQNPVRTLKNVKGRTPLCCCRNPNEIMAVVPWKKTLVVPVYIKLNPLFMTIMLLHIHIKILISFLQIIRQNIDADYTGKP